MSPSPQPMSTRVLIVDDNAMNLELASFLLEAAGCDVHGAHDVPSARQVLHRHAPDLVLLDIQLPGVDGLSFVSELKADERWQALPVVAFTAYAMKGDEQKMRAAGCDGYIAKPIDVGQFARQVLNFLPG